ncbi:MAG: oxygen-dependent coproporphyrinogen oxidase, partial [Ralstonia mannitolilytica]
MDTQAVRDYLLDLQDRITTAASTLDGGTFATDAW